MKTPLLPDVADYEQAVREIEPGIRGQSLRAGALLLVAATRPEIGQDTEALAAFTGYPRSWVDRVRDRLVDAGTWRDGITASDWMAPELGEVTFLCDINIAIGVMSRDAAGGYTAGMGL